MKVRVIYRHKKTSQITSLKTMYKYVTSEGAIYIQRLQQILKCSVLTSSFDITFGKF